MKAEKTTEEINEKIRAKRAVVLTAEEMKHYIAQNGISKSLEKVDVVTTGTFGAMCSSGAFLNFGHTDPPLKMEKLTLNGVPVYGGIAAVDAYIGATERSEKPKTRYGGAHVIEDLVAGKRITLKAKGKPTDCYPLKSVTTDISLADMNQAILLNPRNAYQRYNAAANSTDKTIFTYMGRLLPRLGNITYSGAGELSPLNNDPKFLTIGIGTRIFLGGGTGFVIGSGTQHSPETGFSTLMVKGDLKTMNREFLRGAYVDGYGCTLFVGIGVPIPVLNEEIVRQLAIPDDQITVNIIDYGAPRLVRPALKTGVSYKELKSGFVEINGRKIPTASISSLFMARKIADTLRQWIERGEFSITQAVEPLSTSGIVRPLTLRQPEKVVASREKDRHRGAVLIDHERCIHCDLCMAQCPHEAIAKDAENFIRIDPEKCTLCRTCVKICSVGCFE